MLRLNALSFGARRRGLSLSHLHSGSSSVKGSSFSFASRSTGSPSSGDNYIVVVGATNADSGSNNGITSCTLAGVSLPLIGSHYGISGGSSNYYRASVFGGLVTGVEATGTLAFGCSAQAFTLGYGAFSVRGSATPVATVSGSGSSNGVVSLGTFGLEVGEVAAAIALIRNDLVAINWSAGVSEHADVTIDGNDRYAVASAIGPLASSAKTATGGNDTAAGVCIRLRP